MALNEIFLRLEKMELVRLTYSNYGVSNKQISSDKFTFKGVHAILGSSGCITVFAWHSTGDVWHVSAHRKLYVPNYNKHNEFDYQLTALKRTAIEYLYMCYNGPSLMREVVTHDRT